MTSATGQANRYYWQQAEIINSTQVLKYMRGRNQRHRASCKSPPRVPECFCKSPAPPEPIYSATDKHSASYAVKCPRGRHKITASLDLFALL